MTINERVAFLIIHLENGNKSAFAARLGTSSGVIGDIIGGRLNKPSFGLLEKLVNTYPHVNAEWLLTGQGEMFTTTLKRGGEEGNEGWSESSSFNKDLQLHHQLSENEKQILQRILQVAYFLEEKQNISFKEFCDRIGLNYLHFESYRSGDKRLEFDQLINISNIFLIDANWLLTGEGEMEKDNEERLNKGFQKLQTLRDGFKILDENFGHLGQKLYDLHFDSRHLKKQLNHYLNYLEQTDFKSIIELRNKPLQDLTEKELNILGLERSFDYRKFRNLFFTKDFEDSKIYFNQVGEKFELRGFQIPGKEGIPVRSPEIIERVYIEMEEKLNVSKTNWEEYRMFKIKDILTTEELINEIFQWKFHW